MSEIGGAGDLERVATLHEAAHDEMAEVLVGNEQGIEQIVIALLTRGHVLLEGVPGVGKTTLANLFARVTGLEYTRIQMTPDILPADITGTHVYRENTGEFELQRGPIFSNLVVADEINRATPKTQSALLEAMQERTVTIEGDTLELPRPFMVVATQNPVEMEGVFDLPEAQRDRFQIKITIDLPERANEMELLERFDAHPELSATDVEQVVAIEDIMAARKAIGRVHVADPVKDYMLDVVAATRDHPDVIHGASPRASLAFLQTGKARAGIRGRPYVIPDDIKALSDAILAHRLVLTTDAELRDVDPRDVAKGIVETVDTPSGQAIEFER